MSLSSRLIYEAREYAVRKHATQRYGNQPYTVHLAAVRGVLRWAGIEDDHPLATAAWLHDTLEDTDATREELATRFGNEVADLVWAVTGVGKNRKERNENVYAKIRAYPQAATLKLADRIANVEAAVRVPDKLAMYRKEWPAFREALAGRGLQMLWKRLEKALEG